jgi:sulfopyruvate decarboxylase subunit beta
MSPKVWENSDCGLRTADCGVKHSRHGNDQTFCVLHPSSSPTFTRYDIIKIIAPYLDGHVVVSNLGWPSKELFAIKHQPSNFYMLGSMGMATPIGLGLALASSKEIIVIDGDGSLLMNPGTLATAASAAPRNLTIIAVDNGAYGSTGNQPTLAGTCVDLEHVAQGFGIRNTTTVAGEQQLIDVMKKPQAGPAFIHVLAIPGNKDVPNIPLHHLEIKRQVQAFLRTQSA